MPFEVVFVCTGNRARSPLAAAMLRLHVPEGVLVRSVGTLDLGPVPALTEARRAGQPLGVDLEEHRARALRPGELETADLVIGFEPAHVATAIVEGRARPERAFTLPELAAIVGHIDALGGLGHLSHPSEILPLAHGLRPGGILTAPSIADPFGGSARTYASTAESIANLVRQIAVALWPSGQ